VVRCRWLTTIASASSGDLALGVLAIVPVRVKGDASLAILYVRPPDAASAWRPDRAPAVPMKVSFVSATWERSASDLPPKYFSYSSSTLQRVDLLTGLSSRM
jgi:hypothetical protein